MPLDSYISDSEGTRPQESEQFRVFSADNGHRNVFQDISTIVVFGDSMSKFDACTPWLKQFLVLVNNARDAGSRKLQAYNYACPGSTAEDDLKDQMEEFFDRFPKNTKPGDKPPLDPDQTLYVLWLGTNDCGGLFGDVEEIVGILFDDGLDELYTWSKARNFLLIDVPPVGRSPSASESISIPERCSNWNRLLKERAKSYVRENEHTSISVFSVHHVISDILDNPAEFGFEDVDVAMEGGGIWLDSLHFTSGVHSIIARRLKKALDAIDSI
ncbi:hypothetical protein BJ138DRAFT_1153206 [Hygrophoropsis aurantiaca]|uniref:Uncharacterized protein n=1 Tax=Hygrophoropsis aurantiaca TaxID=72124 RepID=A0ACB8AB56_9AGAM|nr:hypothetical protein BJ138DRAFT_1153206 [Hygrophoropsis aurantiaca]